MLGFSVRVRVGVTCKVWVLGLVLTWHQCRERPFTGRPSNGRALGIPTVYVSSYCTCR